MPGRILTIAKQNLNYINSLAVNAAQAEVAAVTQRPGEQALVWAAIAETLRSLHAQRVGEQESKTAAALTAVARGEFLRGHIAEFFKVTTAVSGSNTQGCLSTNNAAGPANNVQQTISALAADAPNVEHATFTEQENDLPELTLSGFSQLSACDGLVDNSLTTGTECNLFKGASTGLMTGSKIAQNVPFAGGWFSKSSASDTQAVNVDATKFSSSTEEAKHSAIPLYKKAWEAIKEVQPSTTLKMSGIDGKQLEGLKTSESFKKAVKRILLKNAEPYTPSDNDAVNQKIAAVYGAQESEFTTRFWGKLATINIEEVVSGKPQTNLGALRDLEGLARAINYYTTKNAADLTEVVGQLKEKGVCSETKEGADNTCSKLRDAATCIANPICSYNETETDTTKKCKFNATKASKNGVPEAQTQTGGTETTPSDNCEKENEGQKPGEKAHCGWIEDKCKDSSILATKKFALMVSAFVALLF
ncbi:Trypanosome variant surface glycoprotein (A-type)/Trypanosome variant surface glycoprotein C-terminal domain containing protein, putative [Trypanosoma equiperdum]|uniref:Trypanosome variant surface glycoprotein (A-type)/Trypanosome variant surface glycoprotein C-terminal domain containing protein, putative n=1 Tax=Trypanosoma equiperdum TaxID=5694 RepID=A0A1G4IAS3_TRYEQ|nr:Trypanosome variant surface glycoprotein (A-type)/Trypanosome variant surface glycoprotein C-terminal domain containing protein, putative [Trypanosoma equiperdum]